MMTASLEAIRKRLVALTVLTKALSARRRRRRALGVFALVIFVTLPVVMPFLFIRNVPIAMRALTSLSARLL